MTRKELGQIFYLTGELRMWQKEKERLESLIDCGAKWIDGMPHGTGTSDKVGNLATELANCKMMISCKEVEIEIQKMRTIQFIDGMQDSILRQIVFYRCVCCMGWMKVASCIGGRTTAESARKMFNRHFEGGTDEN